MASYASTAVGHYYSTVSADRDKVKVFCTGKTENKSKHVNNLDSFVTWSRYDFLVVKLNA